MELIEKITDENLNLLVEQIIGRDWHVSPLTERYSLTDPYTCYQEWDLHLDEIKDGRLTDHLHKRFTLYFLSHGTIEMQLIIILNIIKEGIEFKKSVENYSFYEFV